MEKATNGQFREFVGKLLVSGNDEKISKIDKTKIQNAIDSFSRGGAVMDCFIDFINNGCQVVDKTVKRALKNLTLLCKIIVPKVEAFVVGDKFKQRAKKEIGIQMYIWDNFREWILNPMKTKILSSDGEIMLEKFNLNKSMHDSQIKDELGNPKTIHVTLFLPLLFHLLKQQPNGEAKEDGLVNNGYANIFHVELEDGRVVAVGVRWIDVEWGLGANELDYGNPWDGGNSFFTPAT